MGCNSTKDALTPVAPESKTQSSGPQQMYSPVQGGPDKMFISLHQNAKDIPLIDADETETAPFPDIDLDDPETEKAATKIQAVFRGHKTRKDIEDTMKAGDDETQNFEQEFSSDDKGNGGIKNESNEVNGLPNPKENEIVQQKPKDILPTPNEPVSSEELFKSVILSKTQSNNGGNSIFFNPNNIIASSGKGELCHAATKIQATFRGHAARKQTAANQKEEDELSKELEKLDPKDELADIDLSDPDLHKAATKIQASFRGHKVRKEVDPQADECEAAAKD